MRVFYFYGTSGLEQKIRPSEEQLKNRKKSAMTPITIRIEDIHQQDTQIDQGVDDRIDELEGEIAGQPPEDQAGKIGDALDGYFDSDKK